jgi:uncharacterized protein (DUF433 family)
LLHLFGDELGDENSNKCAINSIHHWTLSADHSITGRGEVHYLVHRPLRRVRPMLNLPQIEVPLTSRSDGSVRIRGTQVLLEQIVEDFEGGAIADEIVNMHEGLRLSDVFLVLSFYLKHRRDLESYLASRQDGAKIRPKPAA